MTQDKIIWRPEEIVAMCKEAGFADGVASIVGLWGLHEFARIVAAKEREACWDIVGIALLGSDSELTKRVATAIRARGEA